MAYVPKHNRPPQNESLSEKLDRLDIILGKLDRRTSIHSTDLFGLMDEIRGILDDRNRREILSISEISQFETACAVLKKSAGLVLDVVGGGKALAENRSRRNPPQEYWWWFLDDMVSERKKKTLLRTSVTAIIVFLIVAAVFFVYDRFLAPSPETVARYNARQTVMGLMQQDKKEEALIFVEKSLLTMSDDLELSLLKGVILQALGNTQQAKAVFEELRPRYPDPLEFYLSKSQAFLMINRADLSIDEAKNALAIVPDSAEGYLLLGGGQELADQFENAIISYSKAAQLAAAKGDTNTEVSAKMRAATLMQRAPAGLFPGSR